MSVLTWIGVWYLVGFIAALVIMRDGTKRYSRVDVDDVGAVCFLACGGLIIVIWSCTYFLINKVLIPKGLWRG